MTTPAATILQTARLLLRELTPGDTTFLIALLNSPGWLRYIGDRNVRTEEQAQAYLENGPWRSYRENGFGLYLVQRLEDGQALGLCGLLKREGLEHPDIGFAFLPEYMGRGYAFESASAMLEYAKNTLRLPTILAIVLPENQASIRLLEKLGMQQDGTYCLPGEQERLWLYRKG
jgi:[ribosomal protein S5]-alanine N-acetyltransferase